MKLSKIISLLLVPLLLFTLALPAYADGGSESYLIYLRRAAAPASPSSPAPTSTASSPPCPAPSWTATLSRAGTPTSWTATASRLTPSSPRMAPSTPTGVPSQKAALPPRQSPRRTRLRQTKASPSEHTPGHFLSPDDVFHTCGTLRQIRMVFYDSNPLAHPARRLPPALPR